MMLRRVVVALVTFATAASGAENVTGDPLAVIELRSPSKELDGTFPGKYALFSALPPPMEDLSVFVPEDDPNGCTAYSKKPSDGAKFVAVVRRGECTFVEKARLAEAAGAKGLIMVNSDEGLIMLGIGNTSELVEQAAAVNIFVLCTSKSFGEKIIDYVNQTKSARAALSMSVSQYEPSRISEVLIIFMGTALVVAGAFFSTSDLRLESPIAPKREEVVEVGHEMAWGFCVFGSCMLLLLFFFMQYLIYVIIAGFCLGGVSCMVEFGSTVLAYRFACAREAAFTVPAFGALSRAEVMAAIPAIALVSTWLVLRNSEWGWLPQDIIATGFLCWVQRTLRLPSMKIATLFLVLMFFFDIFWVFITPMLFQGKSVMVTVATGGGTGESVPMLVRIPKINDAFGGDRMLGFGDIVLPGLLISYLHRHDLLSRRGIFEGYFFPGVVGYFVGLCATIVALSIMKIGQPALLYLVPGTVGTTLVLGACRGELSHLWDGVPCHPSGAARSSLGGEDRKEDRGTDALTAGNQGEFGFL